MITYLKQLFSFFDLSTRLKLVGIFLLMGIAALFEMIGIGIFFPLLQAMTGNAEGSDQISKYMEMVGISEAWLKGQGLLPLAILILVVLILKHSVAVLTALVQSKFSLGMHARLSAEFLQGYMQLPYLSLISRNPSAIIRTLEQSTAYAFQIGLTNILVIALEVFVGVAISIYLYYLNSTITLLTLGVLGCGFVLFNMLVRNKLIRWGGGTHVTMADALKSVAHALGVAKESKIYKREDYFVEQYAQALRTRARLLLFAQVVRTLPRSVFEMLAVLSMLIFVVFFGQNPAEGDAETLPVLGVFVVAAFRLLPSFNKVTAALSDVRMSVVPLAHLYEEMAEIKSGMTSPRSSEEIGPELVFQDQIKMEGLGYHYATADRAALNKIDLTIRYGESIGIAGASGAGKSTLIDIVLGLLAPTEGVLQVDGVEIRANSAFWQGQIGYVPQSIYLMDDTLRRNIGFGLPDEEIDENLIQSCLHRAGLEDFVEGLEHGVQEVVGDRGVRMSGGQRQRVAIARALYQNPRLLILDEATSALDNETEKAISSVLGNLGHEITTIIVAHRLNTIRKCDRVVFMEAGNIVDVGTFDELSERCDGFRRQVELANLS